MRSEIVGLLDKADAAIGSSVGVVEDDALERAAVAMRNARVRVSYPEEILVVALVGGTGSGKSSLANAVCETEVAEIGGIRPTTDEPLALIPPRMTVTMSGYLDSLGVSRRKPQKVAEWLCLIDMPDTDSVELANRLRVNELLPRLDVVVWVLDPEKYRDAALHHGYLEPLSPYARQFVFVLNQSDRLAPDEVDAVVRDLQLALTEDGIDSGTVIVAAANPPAGPPIGVTELVAHLRRLAETRTGCYDKLLIDLEEAASSLLEATGGSGLDFERRIAVVVKDGASQIAYGNREEAVGLIHGFLETLAGEAGGPVGLRLLDLATGVSGHVQAAMEAAGSVPETPKAKWIRWREPPPEPTHEMKAEAAQASLEASVVSTARVVLAARARANAALADLALSVAGLRAD